MSWPTNNDRAEWARSALEHFAAATEMTNEDYTTKITDLLCDLMHLAERELVVWDDAINRAEAHYSAEIDGELEELWDAGEL